MKLPEKSKQNQKGQVLIIFLLVLVVGVAIVLSLASRTFTDTQTTTTSDQSNRAYFAAEAGVESALKKISGTSGNLAFNLDFKSVNQTSANVNAKPFASGIDGFYAFPDNVAKDDVVQLSLLNNFNDLAAGWYGCQATCAPNSNANFVTIYWQDSTVDSTNATSQTALEVSMIYINAGTYGITKWALDPPVNGRSNNFCSDVSANNITTGVQVKTAVNLDNQVKSFRYSAKIKISDGTYGNNAVVKCINTAVPVGATKVLLRIRPLYNATGAGVSRAEPIGIQPESGFALPSQGYVVESTGSTVSGVTRKLKVIQPFPSLPAIFDYVLFNGSNQPLTK